MQKLSSLLVIALAIVGCATFEQHSAGFQLVTRQLTMRFITDSHDPMLYATRVEEIADQILDFTSKEPTTSIDVIALKVYDLIHWDNLAPADQELVKDLLRMYQNEIMSMVAEGKLPRDQVMEVRKFVTWIRDAAKDTRSYL